MSALSFVPCPGKVRGMTSHHPYSFWRQLGAVSRQVVAVLALSAAGLVGIATREGYTDHAIPDPVHGTRVPTNGFGTTGPDITMASTTTPVKALQRALTDIQKFEGAVKQCVHVPLYPWEYDAYIELSYNIGVGKSGVKDGFCEAQRGGPSTLVTRLNAGDYTGACDAILAWKKAGNVDCSTPGNKVCGGLWADRLRLHRKCLGQAGAEVAP